MRNIAQQGVKLAACLSETEQHNQGEQLPTGAFMNKVGAHWKWFIGDLVSCWCVKVHLGESEICIADPEMTAGFDSDPKGVPIVCDDQWRCSIVEFQFG